jgi:N-acetylneuraminic acid mutarotase
MGVAALAACSGGTSGDHGKASNAAGTTSSAGMPASSGGSSAVGGNGAIGAGASAGGTQGHGKGGATTGGGAGASSTAGGGAVSQGGSVAGVSGMPAGGMPAGGSGGESAAGSGHASGASNGTLGTPTEQALPDLPDVRQEHSVVALDGIVYLIGGYVASKNSASVLAYDPQTMMYKGVADYPGPINHGNAGALNGKIYVGGSYIGADMSTATTETYAYDPGTDRWTAVAPLPAGTERGAACVAVDGDYMYVIGGAHDGKSVDDVARYDPAKDEWETLAKLPERREHCAAGAIGGIIYVAGGRVDGITGVEPKTWAYDPEKDGWTQKMDIDPARGGLAGAVLRDHLLVFGGEGNKSASSGVFPDIDAYDPVTDTWQHIADMQTPRHGYGAAVIGDRVYLMGGAIKQGGTPGNQSSVFYFE